MKRLGALVIVLCSVWTATAQDAPAWLTVGTDLMAPVLGTATDMLSLQAAAEMRFDATLGLHGEASLRLYRNGNAHAEVPGLAVSARWYPLAPDLRLRDAAIEGLFLQLGAGLDIWSRSWVVPEDDWALKPSLVLGIGYKVLPFAGMPLYLEPALVYAAAFSDYSRFKGGISLGWAFR